MRDHAGAEAAVRDLGAARVGDGDRGGDADARGRQITYCYLDEDPVAVAARLGAEVRRRWATGAVKGLLAAPFYAIVPFDWARRLPG